MPHLVNGPVDRVRFSKDGKLVGALARSGDVAVWDRSSGKLLEEMKSLSIHGSIGFTPSNTLRCSSEDMKGCTNTFEILMHDHYLRTGSEFEGLACDFSGDGQRMLVAEHDARVMVMAAEPYQFIAERRAEWQPFEAVRFVPDGKRFYVFHINRDVEVWDLPPGNRKYCIPGNGVVHVSFSATGRAVTCDFAGMLRLWQINPVAAADSDKR